METVAPLGPAYQAGTTAGNPASIAAGIACLEVLKQEGVYEELDRLGTILEAGIQEKANEHNIHIKINRLKGALTVYFNVDEVTNYEEAKLSDGEVFGRFFKLLLEEGINLAPSKYEAWFLTTAHTEDDVKQTIKAVGNAFQKLATIKQ